MQHEDQHIRIAKWLEDIRDSAAFIISTRSHMNAQQFCEDRLVRQAIERNFQIIGEALRRLDRHFPEIAQKIECLPRIISFRNIIVHAYDGIDPLLMWQIVQDDTPKLLGNVESLLTELGFGRS